MIMSQLQLLDAPAKPAKDSLDWPDRWAMLHLSILENVVLEAADCAELYDRLFDETDCSSSPELPPRGSSIGSLNLLLCELQGWYNRLRLGGQTQALVRLLEKVQEILDEARQHQAGRLASELQHELRELEAEQDPDVAQAYRCFCEWSRCKSLDRSEQKQAALEVLADGGPPLSWRQLERVYHYACARAGKLREHVTELEHCGFDAGESGREAFLAESIPHGLADVMEYQRLQSLRQARVAAVA
jgi:hypothetical protein